MNRLSTKLMTAALATAALLSFGAATLSAQAGGAAAAAAGKATDAMSTATAAAKAKVAKAPATPPPTAAEIADAKAKGMVWVNLNTKVYHKSDNSNYGTTKHGQFMSEADAQKAGYKAAQEPVAKAKKAAAAAATAVAPK